MFKGLLNETKGFKYQITLKVELKNIRPNKLNFKKFVSVQQKKQWQIINLVLTNVFKKFFTGLITGLMRDLVGLLIWLSLNTLTVQFIGHY